MPQVNVVSSNNTIIQAEVEEDSGVIGSVNVDQKQLDDDFDLARKNIRELTEVGKEALKGIVDLAKQDDHPRPYEVAGQILKNLSDINKDLLDLHQKRRDTKATTGSKFEEAQNVTNAVFVGSTQELLEMINKKKNAP